MEHRNLHCVAFLLGFELIDVNKKGIVKFNGKIATIFFMTSNSIICSNRIKELRPHEVDDGGANQQYLNQTYDD